MESFFNKVTQKKVVTKTKVHRRKKSSCRTAKPFTIFEKNLVHTKIDEEKKENLDITNSTSIPFLNIPESSNFQLVSTSESFNQKPEHVFSDFSIKRQTNAANSLLLHASESVVLPLEMQEPFSNVGIVENAWRKNQAGFTVNQSTCNFLNSFSTAIIDLHPAAARLYSEDSLDDNLECANVKHKTDLSVNLNSALTDTGVVCETLCLETTNIQDSVEVQSTQITESQFEYRSPMHKMQPNCNTATANHISCSFQNSKRSSILLLNGQLKTENSSIHKEILNECGDLKGKMLKKTKGSLFFKKPCKNSSVSSVASLKNSRKHARLSNSKKYLEKKEKCSDFKTKVSKLQSLAVSKDPLRKEPAVHQRHPFPYINSNDEPFIEKQESAFTSWLNFVLTPNDEFSSEDVKVDSAKLWIESIKKSSSAPAPTKEELSLKAYTAARNMNLLRKAAFNLYQSDEIFTVIKKIENEVDLKKISIRKDRAIHADLGIKKNILEMLLSYNTLWLRIGLETVYGEVINLRNNSDVVGLSHFIIHRFLQNPKIASKFLYPAVINYYKKGYEDEIKCFTLKKFLILVFYLDTAKNGHLIKHNPCLFNKNSKYKTSRDLLLAFSREYLNGEGDVTKHLRHLGYTVSIQQSLLEEFDYSVRNIAVDLRCGLRLGRVVELILEDWTISQKLRINTLNRLTKIHNNGVILKALKNAGIDVENNIEAKNITDGDRIKTLDLLWQIIFKTQISKLINKELLKEENAFLFRSLKLRDDFAAYNALRNYTSSCDSHVFSISDSKLYKENEILQLLFQWCQKVCAHYGVKVHNFTSSFSDGRVLCLLLHHYHPNVLPYESIKFETRSCYSEEQMNEGKTSENCLFLKKNGLSDSEQEKLLKNENDNLTLVFQKFQEIGHIPTLSNCSDMSNTLPDEKVMVTLVSYINIRLMDLSIEIRAARKILHAWRQYKLRKQHEKLKLEIWAILLIQKAWKKYLVRKKIIEETKASIVIQSFWRMYAAKKELHRLKLKIWAVTLIQRAWKKKLARKRLIKEKTEASIVIQSFWRMYAAKRKLSHWKLEICAVTIIQKAWKNYLVKKKIMKETEASIVIQSFWRMYAAKKELAHLKLEIWAVRIIQREWKNYLIKKRTIKETWASIVIQSFWRMYAVKKELFHLSENAIIIQACWRGFFVRRSIKDERIFEARKKILAADSSEAKKLENRTSRSLELLLCKDVCLRDMMIALEELDVCTQLSPHCCERLVKSGGLTVLIQLVLSCNRSIPHMELIKLTTNILLNLAKHEKIIDCIWKEEDILITILHLMKIFREKGATIFTKCCSLLWIFIQDPNKAQIMTEDGVIEQIRSFHYLLTRKQSMEQKRMVAKAFTSKSFNTNVSLKTINSYIFQRDNKHNCLHIDPDWKLGKHRRREFKDPVIAITSVMKFLGITSKEGFNL